MAMNPTQNETCWGINGEYCLTRRIPHIEETLFFLRFRAFQSARANSAFGATRSSTRQDAMGEG